MGAETESKFEIPVGPAPVRPRQVCLARSRCRARVVPVDTPPPVKPYQDITDPTVAKAFAHPLRSRILAALEERTASPSQLATELEVPLGVLSYHVRRLTTLGFLKLVKRVPRRGAVEHYYTATAKPRISDAAWGAMPGNVKETMLGASLTSLGTHLGSAAAGGGFDPPESRLSRQRFRLDAEGFRQAAEALEACSSRLEELERQAQTRQPEPAPDNGEAATVVMMLFRSPAEPSPG